MPILWIVQLKNTSLCIFSCLFIYPQETEEKQAQ
jgi:hypothetical protein